MAVLAEQPLPCPARPSDVELDLQVWMDTFLPDAPIGLLGREVRRNLIERPAALHDLLWLLRAPKAKWAERYDCASLRTTIGDIVRELAPATSIVSRLEEKAREFIEDGLRRHRGQPFRLLSFLGGVHLTLEGALCVLPIAGAAVPLRRLVEDVGQDGIALWQLRELVAGDKAPFDAALDEVRAVVGPSTEAGLIALFDRGGSPRPVDYLAAFQRLAAPGRWTSVIVRELCRRADLKDGFDAGPSADQWLAAAGVGRTWEASHLRRLVRLERLFDEHPEPFAEVVLQAAGLLRQSAPEVAAYGALSLLHLARRRRLASARLDDADLEATVAREAGGPCMIVGVLSIHTMLSDLPAGIRGERCTWSRLGDGEKKLWRCRFLELAEGAALRRASAEFLLAWTNRDTFADVQGLVVELLTDDDAYDYLGRLAWSVDPVTVLRAGCLARELPIDD